MNTVTESQLSGNIVAVAISGDFVPAKSWPILTQRQQVRHFGVKISTKVEPRTPVDMRGFTTKQDLEELVHKRRNFMLEDMTKFTDPLTKLVFKLHEIGVTQTYLNLS